MTTEPFETIGFRAPATMKADALADAERLGLTTAEYGRMAFARLLGDRVSVDTAAGYKTPPTKKELRSGPGPTATPPRVLLPDRTRRAVRRRRSPYRRSQPHPKATARRSGEASR